MLQKLLVAFMIFACLHEPVYAAKEQPKMSRTQKAEQTLHKWAGNGTDPLMKTDPELMTLTNNLVYGEILNSGSLTEVQQSLVILASLTASQGWDEIPQAVQSALAIGASPLQIRETIYQCAPYSGIARTKKAITLVNEEFKKANISLPLEDAGTVTETTRFTDGLAVQKKIFGSDTIENMQKNAPANQKALITDHLSGWCFGDFYTRGVLDLKMRELITFSAIVSLGGCNPQAQAHAQANLNVGNTEENLMDALATMLPLIGYPRTLNGLGCVNAVLAQKGK